MTTAPIQGTDLATERASERENKRRNACANEPVTSGGVTYGSISPALSQQLDAMRPTLLRFALAQLRNPGMAEDAVQDALIAVLEHPDRFAGKSSLRTYVTAILKFKIIDALRSSGRERPIETDERHGQDQGQEDVIDSLFAADGHTVNMPRAWGDPDAALEQKDFFRVLEICLEKLPANTARIFMLREWLELSTEEICKEMNITASNAWVMLYRARIQLRECLDLNWFGKLPAPRK